MKTSTDRAWRRGAPLSLCLALVACVSAGNDAPPERIWVRDARPVVLRLAPDGPRVEGYEAVPYLGWEPVLKFTRGQPEPDSILYVAPTTRYDEHGIPRSYGQPIEPWAYVPTRTTAENADGLWVEHARNDALR